MNTKAKKLELDGFINLEGYWSLNEPIVLNEALRKSSSINLDVELNKLLNVFKAKDGLLRLIEKTEATKEYARTFEQLSSFFALTLNDNNYFSTETTYDFQKIDTWHLMVAKNILVSHEMRLGKTYITSLPLVARSDINTAIIVANSTIASDVNGWMFALNNASKTLNTPIHIANLPICKTKRARIKELLGLLLTPINKKILIVNPTFFTTTLGQGYLELLSGNMGSITIGRFIKKLITEDLKATPANIKWLKEVLNDDTINEKNYNELFSKRLKETLNNTFKKFDVMVGDEIHEYLIFNAQMTLTSKRAKTILKFRNTAVRTMWGLTATPAKKSHIETLGYHLFIHYSSTYKFNKFNTMLHELLNNTFKFSLDNFRGIIPSSIKFRTQKEKERFESFERYFRIDRSQLDVNENKKPLNVETIKLQATDKQYEIYKNFLAENSFLDAIEGSPTGIAKMTYLREISLDHRLTKRVLLNYLQANMSKIKIIHNSFVKNITLINLVNTLKGMLPDKTLRELLLEIKNLDVKKNFTKVIDKYIDAYLVNLGVYDSRGAKSNYLIKLINERFDNLNEEPLVVFTSFTSFIYDFLIDDLLENTNLKMSDIGIITGKTKNRGEILDAFKQGKLKILIGNTKSTATGLNLSRSNHAIYLDLPWQDVMKQQSFARIDSLNNVSVDKNITILSLDAIEGSSVDEHLERYLMQNKENIRYAVKHYRDI